MLDAATHAGVPLAVEPEPGHLLATLADFHHLRRMLGDPPALGLTLDGHCQCLEPLPPADCVRAAAPWLRHVQIEDMRRGHHEHLPFGDGEIDFPPVLEALAATGYPALTVVELPRHSHAGPHFAAQSLPFLHRAALGDPRRRRREHPVNHHPHAPRGSTANHPADPALAALHARLNTSLNPPARAWLDQALDEAADHPGTHGPISVWKRPRRIAEAGRRCGPSTPSPPARPPHAARADPDALARVYREGTAAERRAVLHALPHLVPGPDALPLVEDALRTNDTRLVAAALGPYAARHLDAHTGGTPSSNACSPAYPWTSWPTWRGAPTRTPNSPGCSATTRGNAPPRTVPSPRTCTASWP